MTDKTKLHGSVKRFGVRYGTKLKGKIGKIEAERRLSTKCPGCHYDRVKRVLAGVWHCKKCSRIFTGRAYTTGRASTPVITAALEIVSENSVEVGVGADSQPNADEN